MPYAFIMRRKYFVGNFETRGMLAGYTFEVSKVVDKPLDVIS